MLLKKTIFFIYLSTIIVVIVLISILIKRLSEVQNTIKGISQEANQISKTSITQDIPFNSSIDVDQPMDVVKNLSARVIFNLKKSIFINDSIPYSTLLKIPVSFIVRDSISLDQNLFIDNKMTSIGIFNSEINLDTTIVIDMPGLKKYKFPVKTTIKLDSTYLRAQLKDNFYVKGRIPIKIPINQLIEYPLTIMVPIKNLKVDVNFPVDEMVSIQLKEPIHIKTKIPVNQKVPVDIKISETGLSKPLKTISLKLDKLGDLIFPFE